jgi:hypothetical protein
VNVKGLQPLSGATTKLKAGSGYTVIVCTSVSMQPAGE